MTMFKQVGAERVQMSADEEAAFLAAPQPNVASPPPTLSDWRVALIQLGKFDIVRNAIIAARDSGDPVGLIAWERFEYANNVYRAELLRLAPLFNFTEADVDESLAMAASVAAAAAG
jgi:hypothetical protein